MSSFKTSQLLARSTAVASIGSRPRADRNVLQMVGAAIVLSFAALTATPDAVAGNGLTGNGLPTQQGVQIDRIPAEVISVKKVSDRPDQYERRQDNLENRTQRYVSTAVGGLIGTAIGNQVGGGSGKRYARGAGAIVGAMSGNALARRVAERRQAQETHGSNVSFANQDRVVITVSVDMGGGRAERYNIEQADNYNFRRGDAVYLLPNSDGRTVSVVPQQPEYNNRTSMRR